MSFFLIKDIFFLKSSGFEYMFVCMNEYVEVLKTFLYELISHKRDYLFLIVQVLLL